MKKTALLLSLVLLLCSACAAPTAETTPVPDTPACPTENNAEEAPVQQGGMPPYSCSITYETIDEEKKADDGTIVLLLKGEFPHVEVSNNELATAAIEGHFKEVYSKFIKEEAAETEKYAREDYAERGESFMPYDLDLVYATQRADKDCVSFTEEEYSFTGGAHPNMSREGLTFDTATGRELELKDIVTDEAAAREFLSGRIKAYIEANAELYGPFEDYADHIGEVIDDDEWYFTPTEFVMICNEYILGPHAMGILEIPIAYSDFTLLKSDYAVAK